MKEQTALEQEEKRLQRVRILVDRTAHQVLHGLYSEAELDHLILETRNRVLEEFPDKGELFDLIYASRLRRLHAQWGRLSNGSAGV